MKCQILFSGQNKYFKMLSAEFFLSMLCVKFSNVRIGSDLTFRKKACSVTPGTPNVLLKDPTPITSLSYEKS